MSSRIIRSAQVHDLTEGAEGNARAEPCVMYSINWLRVSGTAELAQIDQRVGQHLHAIMPLLDAFKAEQQPLPSALGVLAVPGVLFDVGDHPRIANAFAIRSGVKAAVKIDIRASQV